ncbi:hypothetical protein GcM3_151011 [Golovinomyces cichoracearum]|uniref:Uncharacterized protein n=1 Tax=Golovinomyces cichoracearum TaxID=62708 RepID=A0A420HWY2_9PEZI|nr:hypothetical protein GcM3_151011 [Golovinomyces cichoracearum]
MSMLSLLTIESMITLMSQLKINGRIDLTKTMTLEKNLSMIGNMKIKLSFMTGPVRTVVYRIMKMIKTTPKTKAQTTRPGNLKLTGQRNRLLIVKAQCIPMSHSLQDRIAKVPSLLMSSTDSQKKFLSLKGHILKN